MAAPASAGVAEPVEHAAPPSTPVLRRWSTWAIPAVVLAGTGVGFLVDAQLAKAGWTTSWR